METKWLLGLAALASCGIACAGSVPPEFLHEANEVFYSAYYVAPNDIDGDGLSDLLWFNAATSQFAFWISSPGNTESHYQRNGAKIIPVTPGYYVSAISDFDGDRKADVIWTSARRDLYLWRSTGSSFDSRFIGTYPDGWKLVGAGDVNGDGDADLLWVNSTTCQFAYWLMHGATKAGSAVKNIACGYRIAAIGHFNQSTWLDLLWTSDNHDVYLWTGTGVGFQSRLLGSYGPGERIIEAAMAGDFGGLNVYTVDDATPQFNQYEWQRYFYLATGKEAESTFGLVASHPITAGSYLGATGNFANGNEAVMVWANDTGNQANDASLPGSLTWYVRTYTPGTGGGTFTSWDQYPVGSYPGGWRLIGAHR